jgi:N-acetylglucosaminyldiphosphoundecaprenol N-acetyl-beta-D-mannosaminyltransferase
MEHEIRNHVHFMGVKIDNVNIENVREKIDDMIKKNQKGYICVTDVGNVIGATRDRQLLDVINSSLLSVADGMPLAWYGRLTGCGQIDRIPGMELMTTLLAGDNGYRHYLLGDTEQRINRVIDKARSINRKIQISGYSPPFKEFDLEDNRLIMDRLNREDPDIVWVSFGGGKQEKWMYNNINELNRGIMIGVGAAFKWFIGDLIVPPRIVQRMGMQWVYRVGQALLRDPMINMKIIIRIVLKKKLIFMLHFPGEVMRARRRHGLDIQ